VKLVKDEMPREKLLRMGASALSDVELLQIVIGSGGRNNDFKQIAKNLNIVLSEKGAESLIFDDVKSIKGIGNAKATFVFAALEFWRRRLVTQTSPLIDSPEKALSELGNIRNKKQEHFALLTLDGARRLINNRIVTIGILNASLVHPREVFAYAIEDRAASIIVAHNHPSGVLTVSESDKNVTSILKQVGDIVGIRLDDHLVVSGENYVSVMA
jgi:DNA repair protein RadC